MRHIPYSRQSIDDSDIQAVVDVLKSDWLTQGPQIAAFEEALKRYLGAEDVVVVSNGSSALHLSYLALNLQGATVFTTPITFAATSNMLHAVGAQIRFVDVDPTSGLMDMQALGIALQTNQTSTKKAIVPVSLQGIAETNRYHLATIYDLAQRYGAQVIEDAAHSLGAEYTYRNTSYKSAACKHSDLATLSFHPLKSITCGEGGAVIVRTKELADKVRLLRNHGLERIPDSYLRQQKLWGYNARISELQAALGLSQLKRLPFFLNKRKSIAIRYYEAFNTDFFRPYLTASLYPGSAYHLYVIHFNTFQVREGAYHYLKSCGVEISVHYQPLHKMDLYRQTLGEITLPGAETYYRGCLSLPIYPDLTEEDQLYVVECLKKYCSQLKL